MPSPTGAVPTAPQEPLTFNLRRFAEPPPDHISPQEEALTAIHAVFDRRASREDGVLALARMIGRDLDDVARQVERQARLPLRLQAFMSFPARSESLETELTQLVGLVASRVLTPQEAVLKFGAIYTRETDAFEAEARRAVLTVGRVSLPKLFAEDNDV